MDEFDTSDHGHLVMAITASVDQVRERIDNSDTHLSLDGLKVWYLLDDSGEERGLLFCNTFDKQTMVIMLRPEDNPCLPDFIYPDEVLSASLFTGNFPLADMSQVYRWNEPEHEVVAFTSGVSAFQVGIADPDEMTAERGWHLRVYRGNPATSLPALHRMAWGLRQGIIPPTGLEMFPVSTIARVSEDDNGDLAMSCVVL